MKLTKAVSLILIAAALFSFTPLTALKTSAQYDGRGAVIAVLDKGFELSHESFVLTHDSPKLTKEESDRIFADICAKNDIEDAESAYVNEKIPFAYDYGDGDNDVSHPALSASGTALISIAAGNGKQIGKADANGTAPEAQILAMKIFSDELGDVSAKAAADAIYDSVYLGADVILIGAVQFPAGLSANDARMVEDAIDYAESKGVIVVMGINSISPYGTGSAYYNNYSFSMPISDCADIGTVSWPASLEGVFTVASAESNVALYDCLCLFDKTEIPYSDTNAEYECSDKKSFAVYFSDKALEYVTVDGIGAVEDFAKLGDISGKIAVVKRGEITFAEKAKNAAERGALGIIVIDNQSEREATLTTRMDLTDAPIPAILISMDDGELLVSQDVFGITVTAEKKYEIKTSETPIPRTDTARGTTYDMHLKPDISAIGTNVPCALVDGSYGYFTSPSAAAARIAGMCVCVKAKLVHTLGSISPSELAFLTKASLTSSAQIMEQTAGDAPYSPRTQGGGIASLDAALESELILSCESSHKIDGVDAYRDAIYFNFTLTNLGENEKTCTLDSIVGSDSFDVYKYSELASLSGNSTFHEALGKSPDDTVAFLSEFTPFENTSVTVNDSLHKLNAYSDNTDPLTFTIGPNTSFNFAVFIGIDSETYEAYRTNFDNGFFVEGYMRVTEGESTFSIPFVTYSGDFSDAPTFDASLYSSDTSLYDYSYLYRNLENGSYSILGAEYIAQSGMKYSDGLLAFSPSVNSLNASVMLNLALLRSVRDVTVTVSDADGEIVKSSTYNQLMRTHTGIYGGTPTSARIELWDGRAADNPSYVYPDGEYTVEIEYFAAGSNAPQSIKYTLILDTEAPVLNSYEFAVEDDCKVLRLDALDNTYLSSVSVNDASQSATAMKESVVFDITSLTGKYIYIELSDIVYNRTVIRIENPYFQAGS